MIPFQELYPITSVGCGKLKRPEMDELITQLRPFFVKNKIPGVKFKGRRRPDLFIDPANSVIVQVKASEILYSKEYVLNYSLRFPRIIAVRRDKRWNEATTVKEFHELRIACKGKLVKRSDRPSHNQNEGPSTSGALVPADPKNYFENIDKDFNFTSSDDEGDDPNSKKKSRKKLNESPTKSPLKGILLRAKTALDKAKIQAPDTVELNIFESRVFCVVSTYEWRKEMEMKLMKYGGIIVRNPTKDTFCIVAETEKSQTVINKKKEGSYDIVKPSWIDECIQRKAFQPFLPKDLFFAKKATQDFLSQYYDIYGDSHTKKCSLAEVKELIHNVIQKHVIPEKQPSPSKMEAIKRQIDQELFPGDAKMKKWSFLSECKIAFRGQVDILTKCSIEFYGGTVVSEEWDPSVTHVILPSNSSSAGTMPRCNSSAFLMKRSWIEDCLQKKELLSEFSYMVE